MKTILVPLRYYRLAALVCGSLLVCALTLFSPALIQAQTAVATTTPPSSPIPGPGGAPLRMSLDAGFDGHFRPNTWTPILVSVSNDGPDLSGELVINAESGALGLSSASYHVPLTLPTHSSKRLFVYATFNGAAQRATVDLVDAHGVTQISSTVPLSLIDPINKLYVVVDESPVGAVDLSAARPAGAVAYQAQWTLDHFPDMADGWQAVDGLLLTDTDTSQLSSAQRRALGDWVMNGGHLILSGGPDWQKTISGLADLSPLNVTTTVTLPSISALAVFSNQPSDSLLLGGPVIAATGTISANAEVLAVQNVSGSGNNAASAPLIVRRAVGSGLVDYLSVDPDLVPLRGWSQRTALWQSLLTADFGQLNDTRRPGWASGVVSPPDASNAVTSVLGLRFPDALQVGLFLLVYIVLIGPLNYLLLRAIRRLEWAWLTIPLLIVLATGAAYITGFDLRGTQPIINRLAVIQLWPGQARARVDGLLGLVSPHRGFYDMTLGDGLTIRGLAVDSSGFGIDSGPNAQVVEAATVSSSGYRLRHVAVEAGLASSFRLSGTIPAPAIDGTAAITIAADGTTVISGTVRNNSSTALSNGVVIAFNNSFALGTVAAGETRPFSFTLDPLTALAYALPRDIQASDLYNYGYNGIDHSSPSLSDLIQTGSSLAADLSSTLNQRLNNERKSFMAAMIDSGELGGVRGSDVYFVAWGDTLPLVTTLDNSPSNSEDNALYAVQLAQTAPVAQTTGQSITLPAGLTGWREIPATPTTTAAVNNGPAQTPYGIFLATTGEQTAFEYAPLNGLRLATISQITLTEQTYEGSHVSIALWDWSAQQWATLDPAMINADGHILITDPLAVARFAGLGGVVRVQITATDGQTQLNRLDVTFDGILAAPGTPLVEGF